MLTTLCARLALPQAHKPGGAAELGQQQRAAHRPRFADAQGRSVGAQPGRAPARGVGGRRGVLRRWCMARVLLGLLLGCY